MNALTKLTAAKRITFTLQPDELPEVYIMRGDGRCMEPAIMDEQRFYVSSVERCRPGDFVVVFKKPEFTAPGDHQMLLKKLIYAPPVRYFTDPASDPGPIEPPSVILEMLNPVQRIVLPAWSIMGMHKVTGLVPDEQASIVCSDDWFRAEHRRRKGERA